LKEGKKINFSFGSFEEQREREREREGERERGGSFVHGSSLSLSPSPFSTEQSLTFSLFALKNSPQLIKQLFDTLNGF